MKPIIHEGVLMMDKFIMDKEGHLFRNPDYEIDKFICPKCKTEWERNTHYKAIVHNQNMINMMMSNPEIIVDMCGKCNYMVEDK
jgi:hypothetical protein